MINYLWAAMLLIGIVAALLTGRLPEVTEAVISSSKEAVTVCITMLGILSFWTGLMKVAESAGIIKSLTKRMIPVLKFIFPELKPGSKAMEHISTNIIANILGLGWAATPAGLMAMKELQKDNPDKETASRTMCAFLIFNMSSLQIISVNLIAYRMQYNSANPSEIIAPGLMATFVSTAAGVFAIKALERLRYHKRNKL